MRLGRACGVAPLARWSIGRSIGQHIGRVGGGGARRVVRWVRVERVLDVAIEGGLLGVAGGVALEGIQGVEGLEHGGDGVAEFGGVRVGSA